jgi:hypothetical protein
MGGAALSISIRNANLVVVVPLDFRKCIKAMNEAPSAGIGKLKGIRDRTISAAVTLSCVHMVATGLAFALTPVQGAAVCGSQRLADGSEKAASHEMFSSAIILIL